MTGHRPITLFNLRAVPKVAPVEPVPSETPAATNVADVTPRPSRRSWIALASGVWLAPVLKRGGTNVA